MVSVGTKVRYFCDFKTKVRKKVVPQSMIIMNRGVLYCIGLCLVIVVLFASNLLLGSVSIPAEDVMRILLGDPNEKASWRFIILESRLPQAITAMFCGASLAVSGLMLQTIFRNPPVIRWQVRVSSVSTAVRV